MNKLAKKINEINRANGWNMLTPEDWKASEYKIPAILALIHSEVSEALEAFRKNDRENFAEEMADVVIRCLDCTGGLDIDIQGEIMKKLEKNAKRGYRHGNKRV
jgi:NTP pyrophosphatase (non-canonical NTP hydrolase)